MQPELAAELLKSRRHFAAHNTAVETRLHVPWKYIAPLTALYRSARLI